jgi:release factor glutamine methyltransferase
MSTIAQTLRHAALALDRYSDSPRLDAELLLGKLLGQPRSGLISRSEEPVAAASEHAFAGLIEARRGGAPVAYLTGSREFWSLPLTVTPAVLVPRPETEILVEEALRHMDAGASGRLLDLGTGSGAIALALAGERPSWRITAVDVSKDALAVAADNGRALNCPNIEWRLGNWFEAVASMRFEVIVSNPPYVAAADPALAKLVAEPALALSSGPTGLEALEAIIARSSGYLDAAGVLLLEHGHDQSGAVVRLFQRHGFSDIRTHMDLSGNPRVTRGILHSQRGTS